MALRKRFMIERDIAGIGGMSIVELCGASRASNQAIEKVGKGIQWQHSYVAGDKIYCIYIAPNEEMVREHASQSGFPANKITEVAEIIDPTTAEERTVGARG